MKYNADKLTLSKIENLESGASLIINGTTPIEKIKAIPAINCVVLNDINAEQLKAIPPHVNCIAITSHTSSHIIKSIPKDKWVIISSFSKITERELLEEKLSSLRVKNVIINNNTRSDCIKLLKINPHINYVAVDYADIDQHRSARLTILLPNLKLVDPTSNVGKSLTALEMKCPLAADLKEVSLDELQKRNSVLHSQYSEAVDEIDHLIICHQQQMEQAQSLAAAKSELLERSSQTISDLNALVSEQAANEAKLQAELNSFNEAMDALKAELVAAEAIKKTQESELKEQKKAMKDFIAAQKSVLAKRKPTTERELAEANASIASLTLREKQSAEVFDRLDRLERENASLQAQVKKLRSNRPASSSSEQEVSSPPQDSQSERNELSSAHRIGKKRHLLFSSSEESKRPREERIPSPGGGK